MTLPFAAVSKRGHPATTCAMVRMAAAMTAFSGWSCAPPLETQPSLTPPEKVTIELTGDQHGMRVLQVAGLSRERLHALTAWSPDDARWPELLRVCVAGAGDGPAVLGAYSLVADTLRFTPRFVWQAGLRYRAELRAERIDLGGEFRVAPTEPLVAEFTIAPAAGTLATQLTAVYPSAETLPENLLKFYLQFSAPMARGEAYERVHLLDADGKPIERAFLELGEELWDPAGRRFTLFFDPGRIKRGLKPREDLGAVLVAGRSYTLAVDAAWRDAAGQPLAHELRKSFDVGPSDDVSPDTATWSIDVPSGGTSEPLTVRFPEPLDQALLTRLLSVADARGEMLTGDALVDQEETRWQFRPSGPWQPGEYQLLVGTVIEDLAGNSPARPFEVDVQRVLTRELPQESIALPFEIKVDAGP
ncbi:MAG TPA: hypothetical protein VGX76_17700 [Pirellulales bacterium]|jgi:hypothetical protein|nr:hypothetical protein [Pirellulales bacterium]